MKKLIDRQEMERMLDRLAFQVMESCPDLSKMCIVGIHRRGVFLARRIKALVEKYSGSEIKFGTLDITLYRDDLQEIADFPKVYTTDLPDVTGQVIILVDDVVFTGRTTRAALEAVTEFGRPDRILFLALIDRGHRELPIQPDFVGKVIPTRRSELINVNMQELDGEDSVIIE